MRKSIIFVLCCLAVTAVAQQYTKEDELVLPPAYREWIFLSSGIGILLRDSAS